MAAEHPPNKIARETSLAGDKMNKKGLMTMANNPPP